ncbi:MAG: hypothetical protein A2413_05495 [Treponema sp. RIFOXYC1_FULL_61_9]|nr:MAG: hypothetical protein A2001_12470 [Treponema sp. GWC1_61_84]OHE71200.1 MAG: hypothetical protein A2413_05495 [Treponema sp. RIFOXYC1_FULL_61_9]
MSRYLLFSNIALVLLPMLLVGTLSFTLVGSQYRKETAITVRSIMRSVEAKSAQHIGDSRRLVEYLSARFADFESKLDDGDRSALQTAQATAQGIRSVIVLGSDYRVAASAPLRPESIGDDYSRRPFLVDLADGRTVMSMPFVNPETETMNVAVARKERNAVVVAFLDLDALSDFLKDLLFSPKDEAALADATGAFIAHTDRRMVRERSREDSHAELRGIGGLYLKEKKTETRSFLAAGIPVSGTPWTVLYYRDAVDAYSLIIDLAVRSSVAVIFLAFAAVVSAVLSRRAFSRRIRALLSYIDRVEYGGSEDLRYGDDSWREFREIGNAFSAMSARIGERETALRKSEDQYRGLFLLSNAVTLIIDAEGGNILDANPAAVRYYGFARKELLSLNMTDINACDEAAIRAEEIAANRERREHLHFKHQLRGGEIRDVETYVSRVDWEGRNCLYTIIIDTTERRIAEERLARSLEEKNVMLREIHHRVKNNMQIMSSLLHLQSRYVRDPADEALFEASQNRIRSMALIHELIYQREDLSSVDLSEYASNLVRFYKDGAVRAGAEIDTDCVSVSTTPEIALPFGLILNELISNSIKYAFPSDRPLKDGRRIDIRLTSDGDGSYALAYSDNGAGLKPGVDPETTESLGFSLIRSLSDQIAAKVTFRSEKGFHVDLVYKK